MKRILFLLVVIGVLAVGPPATANQTPPASKAAITSVMVDHWQSIDEALAADPSAPYYYPDIKRPKPLGPNQIVRGLPRDCFLDMDVPDRMTVEGHAFVKVNAGRRIVYDATTGEPLWLEECGNRIRGGIPIPLPKGEKGDPGQPGRDGKIGPQGPPGRDGYSTGYYNQYGYPSFYSGFYLSPFFTIEFGMGYGWGSCGGWGYNYDRHHCGHRGGYTVNKTVIKNYYITYNQQPQRPRGHSYGTTGPAYTGNGNSSGNTDNPERAARAESYQSAQNNLRQSRTEPAYAESQRPVNPRRFAEQRSPVKPEGFRQPIAGNNQQPTRQYRPPVQQPPPMPQYRQEPQPRAQGQARPAPPPRNFQAQGGGQRPPANQGFSSGRGQGQQRGGSTSSRPAGGGNHSGGGNPPSRSGGRNHR